MKDNKEMVSAFVDGEISDRNQLDTLFDEPELQAQWQRYHLIKDNLGQDPKVELPVDFVQSVMNQIENEPVIASPSDVPTGLKKSGAIVVSSSVM